MNNKVSSVFSGACKQDRKHSTRTQWPAGNLLLATVLLGWLLAPMALTPAQAEDAGQAADLPDDLGLIPRVTADYMPMDGVIDTAEWAGILATWQGGSYAIDPLEPSGYSTGTGLQEGVPHSADYQQPTWSLDAGEVVHQAAIWHAGGYKEIPENAARFVPVWTIAYTWAVDPQAAPARHYVNAASTEPLYPYTTAVHAATTIQDAIDASSDGAVILVAPGLYTTGQITHSNGLARVVINKSVALLSEVGPQTTIIQGSISPAVRPVIVDHPGAVLQGFTLSGGAAGNNPATLHGRAGGGLLGLAYHQILDCHAEQNQATPYGYGGGFALLHQGSGTFARCVARSNSAYLGGGAAFLWGQSQRISRVSFFNNHATYEGGGFIADNTTFLHSLLVVSNTAAWAGGGFMLANNASAWHATVEQNSAPAGGGILFDGNLGTLYNSIASSNTGGNIASSAGKSGNRIINGLISGTIPAEIVTSNLVAGTPGFAAPGQGDFRIDSTSPAAQAGRYTAGLVNETDLDEHPRNTSSTPDLGAYAVVPVAATLNGNAFMPGQPVDITWTGDWPELAGPVALGVRFELPSGWMLSAATSAVALHHQQNEVILPGPLTNTPPVITLTLQTTPGNYTQDVAITAFTYWVAKGMTYPRMHQTATLGLTSSDTNPWWTVEALAGTNGSVNPALQYVHAGTIATVLVQAVTWYEIEHLTVDDQPVTPAIGLSTYELTLLDVTTNHLVLAAFRPQATEQGVPLYWLADFDLTNDPPETAAATDYDDDNMPTWAEFIAGTSPVDGGSIFLLDATPETLLGGDITLGWPSIAGRRYHLYACENLAQPIWTLVAGDLAATPPHNQLELILDSPTAALRIVVELEE